MLPLPTFVGCTSVSDKMDRLDIMPDILPTPPKSSRGTSEPKVPPAEAVVLVSTAFFPGAEHTPAPPDLILMSSDNIYFYVHSSRMLPGSNNSFDSRWPPSLSRMQNERQDPPLLVLPESSLAINLMLHVVYGLSFNQYAPSNEDIIQAVDALEKYGFSLRVHAYPNTHLYTSILSRAPMAPIDMYALAANHNMEELAVAISSHLLSFDLSGLTDKLAERMGAVYLRRLIFLHLGRADALKRLLLPPPEFHGPTPTCGFEERGKLMRAWSLATASLAWDARPDLLPSTIQSVLGSLLDILSCQTCRIGIQTTVKTIVSAWANVKATI